MNNLRYVNDTQLQMTFSEPFSKGVRTPISGKVIFDCEREDVKQPGRSVADQQSNRKHLPTSGFEMNFGLFVFALTISSSWAAGPINARAVLDNPVTGVSGVLNLTQLAHGVQVTGQVSGLTPGKHGFHIHQWGDIYTKGCDSTGGHYNPAGVPHGAQDAFKRHVGDLGNIVANRNGVAVIDFTDHVFALFGAETVVGRAFVVHAGEDDLGLGNNEGSAKTGNAGGRVACGIIALVP